MFAARGLIFVHIFRSTLCTKVKDRLYMDQEHILEREKLRVPFVVMKGLRLKNCLDGRSRLVTTCHEVLFELGIENVYIV